MLKMDSLSFSLEERELPLSADVEFHTSRNLLLSDVCHGMESIESGSLGMLKKSNITTQFLEHLVDDTNVGSDESLLGIPIIPPNSSLEIGSSFSNSAVQTHLEIKKSRESKCNDRLHNENSLPAKRGRVENFPPLMPVCIVLGCNKDLSSLKEYHKKHRVCDVHSKTSVVIVNGIRQRFCQQCSRFHILAEFDEGKRSCRKRLADHNERRRKPHLNSRSGSMLFKAGFFSWQSNEPTNHIIPLQLQNEATQISKSDAVPQAFGKHYSYKNELDSPLLSVELSGSYSSCAPSLLSAQSQSSLTNSEITSTNPPLVFRRFNNADLTLHQKAARCFETRIPDTSISLSFGTTHNKDLNLKSRNDLSPEGVNIVNLLQLSLHLQRIQEQQKSSAPDNVFV